MTIQDVLDQLELKLAYSREEAAKLISQSPATLDRLAAKGLIKPSRATRRPVYPLEEILRYLSSTKQGEKWLNRSAVDRTGRIGPTHAGASARTRGMGCRKGSLGDRTPVRSTADNQGLKKEEKSV